MKLYGSLASPFVAKVVMMARAMDVDLPMEMPPGGFKSPEHLAVFPWGKIPCMEDGDVTLGESEVICEYLQDKFPEKSLHPADPGARAHVRLVSRVTDLYVWGAMVPLLGQMDPAHRDGAIVEATIAKTGAELDNLEKLMGEGPFMAGPTLTLADCTALPVFHFLDFVLPAFGAANILEARPQVKARWDHLRGHPLGSAMDQEMAAAIAEFQRARAAQASQPSG